MCDFVKLCNCVHVGYKQVINAVSIQVKNNAKHAVAALWTVIPVYYVVSHRSSLVYNIIKLRLPPVFLDAHPNSVTDEDRDLSFKHYITQ